MRHKKYKVWSPRRLFNEGWISSHLNRFFVRLPGHHRANNGRVLRSIANYEYWRGKKVTRDYVIHHIDGNQLNDHVSNLKLMKFGEHSILHNKGKKRPDVNQHLKNGVNLKCEKCGKSFYRAQWELVCKKYYCSKECFYNDHRRKIKCKFCGKEKIIIKNRSDKYCSKSCGVRSRKNKIKRNKI